MTTWLSQLDNEKVSPEHLLVEVKLVKESWERRNELINSCGIKSCIGNFQGWLDPIKIRRSLHQILPWLSNDQSHLFLMNSTRYFEVKWDCEAIQFAVEIIYFSWWNYVWSEKPIWIGRLQSYKRREKIDLKLQQNAVTF